MPKHVQTAIQLPSFHTASRVVLKILQERLQHYMNFQMCKLGFEKAEESEIKVPTFIGS